MPAGGFAVSAPSGTEFEAKITPIVIISCIMAATGGLMFGYDVGVSGGVTSMNDFLKKFFPKVYRKKNEPGIESNYCKYDNQGLQLFTSSLYLAGLTATFFASYTTRRLGRRLTMLIAGFFFIGGVIFNGAAQDLDMLIVGRILLGCGVGFANQVIWEPYGQQVCTRVIAVCLAIWLARVPLISWKRIEWYLPDHVLRQFGMSHRVDVTPIDLSFQRVDGCGKADVDWVDYHQVYISQWETGHDLIIVVDDITPYVDPTISRYMWWYRSWASLYMLRAPTILPTTYYPRTPEERLIREYILDTQDIFQPYFGRDNDTDFQHSINTYEELCREPRKNMHISDNRYMDTYEASSSSAAPSSSQPHIVRFDTCPSSIPDVGPHSYPFGTPAPYSYQKAMLSPFQSWQAADHPMYPHPSVYMPHMHGVYPNVPFQPGPSQEILDVTSLDDSEHTTD